MTTYSIPPTVLYIKQHSITGLKYFGKTTQDPLKYKGSGIYWTNHIKKHGRKHVINLWISEPYTDSITITEFALAFSKEHNIVESKLWANIEPENGLNGGGSNKGISHSEESKQKMRKTKSDKHCQNISIGKKGKPGKPTSAETKQKQSDSNKGKPKSDKHRQNMRKPKRKIECPHCGKIGGINLMKRYHFDNCKKIKSYLASPPLR